MLLNKKLIIFINQEIGEEGTLINESSLDFALHIIKEKRSWLYELAYLVRCLLVDHVFEDGNKRTAYLLIMYYFDIHHVPHDKERVKELIYYIAKSTTTNINTIVRRIDDAIIPERKD